MFLLVVVCSCSVVIGRVMCWIWYCWCMLCVKVIVVLCCSCCVVLNWLVCIFMKVKLIYCVVNVSICWVIGVYWLRSWIW